MRVYLYIHCGLTRLHGVSGGSGVKRAVLLAVHTAQHHGRRAVHMPTELKIPYPTPRTWDDYTSGLSNFKILLFSGDINSAKRRNVNRERNVQRDGGRDMCARAAEETPRGTIGAHRPIAALHFKRFPFSMSRSI
ncbi:hypothetical protein ACJJTC_005297 [Scirpophaga incertulas]